MEVPGVGVRVEAAEREVLRGDEGMDSGYQFWSVSERAKEGGAESKIHAPAWQECGPGGTNSAFRISPAEAVGRKIKMCAGDTL